MGSLIGHVAPGFGFLIIGLWHLFNHTKLHAVNPAAYRSRPWFPSAALRHLELFFIMAGCAVSVSMELFIGPNRHQPLDPDGSIPSYHLRNFEHSSISLAFFVYAAAALLLDRLHPPPPAASSVTELLGAAAFAQQLLLFRLHSTDHMGVEGQYHMLLQMVVSVSVATTVIGISLPENFPVGFVRSLSIIFQGIWFIVMGFELWTPELVPKGCFIHEEEGHQVVRCTSGDALGRAKSLVNIQFSWFLIGMMVFAVAVYVGLVRLYGGAAEYQSLTAAAEEKEEESEEDVEAQKKSFLQMGKGFSRIDMER
ncbi:uncharacterized protein LOC131149719 [Malania oleifera]|uniref:uncharacterized protein LOC131149719 n=1 Tax=Malania oleifera TaxID=397392 RepID=UPI0025AE6B1A|nr:uncharacterized protein LOC131149719 [Malania oleifera]